jgi:hypothetical protein
VFYSICRKIKNYPLQKELKQNRSNILSTSYATKIEGLYDLDLSQTLLELRLYFRSNENVMAGTIMSNLDKAIIIILYRVEVAINDVDKIKVFDLSFIQQMITNVLKNLLVYLREDTLHDKKNVLNTIASLKADYKPERIIYRPLKEIDINQIKDVISKSIHYKTQLELEEFLQGLEIDHIVSFFLNIVLFTIDKIKKIIYEHGKFILYTNSGSGIFEMLFKKNGRLAWLDYYYYEGSLDYAYVELGDKEQNFEDFLNDFFFYDIKKYIEEKTKKSLNFKGESYLLRMIVLQSLYIFTLNFIMSSVNFSQFLHLDPKVIKLIVKENNNVLEIKDRRNTFSLSFNEYNASFLNHYFPILTGQCCVAFYVESGVLEWEYVSYDFFYENKFDVEESFLFIAAKKPGQIAMEVTTYFSIEHIVRVLDFLTGGNYDKSLFYKKAVSILENKLLASLASDEE